MTLFIVTNIIVTWNVTNFPLYITAILFHRTVPEEATYDREAWETWLILRFDKLGELFVCPICLGHWVALIVGGIFYFTVPGLPWFYPILCMFSMPWLSYAALNKLCS